MVWVGASVPCWTVASPISPSTNGSTSIADRAEHGGRPPAGAAARPALGSDAASANPASAVRKPSPVALSSDATGSSGPSGCEKATAPQGNPPNGTRARSASPVIQAPAAQSGQSGSRRDAAAIKRADRRGQQRLHDAQRVPREVADVDVGEAEQRQEERQTEDESEAEPGLPAATVQRQTEQRESDDRHPPPGRRRERGVQRQPAGD